MSANESELPSTSRRVTFDDDDRVAACPQCDAAPVTRRVGGPGHGKQTTATFACYECGWRGEEYTERAPLPNGNTEGVATPNKGTLAKKLADAEPDDLITDGGWVSDAPDAEWCPKCQRHRVSCAHDVDVATDGGRRELPPQGAYFCTACDERFPRDEYDDSADALREARSCAMSHGEESDVRFDPDVNDEEPEPVTDGGYDRVACVNCNRRYSRQEHNECPNCSNADLGEFVTDGGRVQDDRRKCARCDADAIPGSRFCLGHSDVLPDGGQQPGRLTEEQLHALLDGEPVSVPVTTGMSVDGMTSPDGTHETTLHPPRGRPDTGDRDE